MTRTKEQISYTMSRIRSKDTSIELFLRKALWREGLRYRKHYRNIVGTPDIVFVGKKIAVFCDSSFWHGRNWKKRKAKLLSNREYWIKKIEGNIARDKRVNKELEALGWTIYRFWDDEIINDLPRCINKLRIAIGSAEYAK